MNFEQFQNQARLYVLGALYSDELDQFEQAKAQFGSKGKAWIRDCCALREAFALSLRPASSREAITRRLSAHVAQGSGRLSITTLDRWIGKIGLPNITNL